MSSFDCSSQVDNDLFINSLHDIFIQTAAMKDNSPEEEMKNQTEVWRNFCRDCDTAFATGQLRLSYDASHASVLASM